MQGQRIGYVRVSTVDHSGQEVDRMANKLTRPMFLVPLILQLPKRERLSFTQVAVQSRIWPRTPHHAR
jgi:hypothetical protein